MLKRLLNVLLIGSAALVAVYMLLAAIGWIRVYRTPTSSMAPTALPGELIFATGPKPKLDRLQRGALVIFDASDVFESHPSPTQERSIYFIRAVALPGDRLDVVGNELQVNGQSLPTRGGLTAVPAGLNSIGTVTYPLVVPHGQVFMLGDNYANSLDSRYFGTVPIEKIFMVPRVRFWPVSRIGRLE